jgi:hypothetical protein
MSCHNTKFSDSGFVHPSYCTELFQLYVMQMLGPQDSLEWTCGGYRGGHPGCQIGGKISD